LGGRERMGARDRLPRQDVEARHRLRERLAAEQRTGRRAGRAEQLARHRHEGTEAAFRRQRSGGAEQPQLEEVASRDATPRELTDNLSAALSRAPGIPETSLRCVARQVDPHGYLLLTLSQTNHRLITTAVAYSCPP